MENFDIAKWKKNFLNENTQEKYQVVFHDYSGEDVPYTQEFFDSEGDAERWAQDNKNYSEDYDEITYYNPEYGEYFDGYHIEKVAV
jgi:hypothetical protein